MIPSMSNIDPDTIPIYTLELSTEEVKEFLEILEHDYVPYNLVHAHEAIRRMQTFVIKQNELAKRDNSTT